jgi:predicted anti-sigma-YlaC factor YlaD
MKDMRRRLERLRDDAADCAVIAGLAETKEKRELFARLAEHLNMLADQVEQAISVIVPPDTFSVRKNCDPGPK